MIITSREFDILQAVCRYYVLNREQVQRLLFPDDTTGRVTRRRLQLLVDEKLLNRQQMVYAHPSSGNIAPVYYPSAKGVEVLAEHLDQPRLLKTPSKPPIPHHVWHWLAVAETHIAFDLAIAAQTEVQMDGWINEYDELDPSASLPEKKYKLFTIIREKPRLVCVPDAAFLLRRSNISKVFYLEQDRATSGVQQIAASKTPGYFGLSETKSGRLHFPENSTGQFDVLMVAPTPKRRDALRRAISETLGAHLWRFAAMDDVCPSKVLSAPIWYPCVGDPGALVRGAS